MEFMPCYFNSHMFNIYIPIVDEIDAWFHFPDIYDWCMKVDCFLVFAKKNLGPAAALVTSAQLLPWVFGFCERVTTLPAGGDFRPFRTTVTLALLLDHYF